MGELADFLAQNDENFRRGRLPALYSDFRSQRTLNPDGYQANVAAWRHALSRAAWEGRISQRGSAPDLLVLKLDDQLPWALENKQFGRPLAIGAVVGEALAAKELLPLTTFLKARESIYQRSWTELPWNMVSWTFRQLGLTDSAVGDKLPSGQFVIVKNLEAVAKLLSEKLAADSSRFERVFSAPHFRKTFVDALIKDRRLSDTDFGVLLKFLSRDKGSIVYDGKTVKIRGAGEAEDKITEEDIAVASLKELIDDLTHQTQLLSTRIDDLAAAAKDAVSKKNRVAALAALRSKKLAEASLETRFATLAQLEQVAAKIQQAADQVQLVRVMQSSAGVLRGLNAAVGGADRVAEVVDLLREQMGEVDEVGAVLAEPGAAVDESEVDDELEAMEMEEKRRADEAERAVKEAEARREAEALRRQLDEAGRVPTAPLADREMGRESPATETARELGQLEIKSPEPELAQ